AGKALGPLPLSASPFFYWLHRLYQHLCENRSSFSKRFYIDSLEEGPFIDSVCEASSTFCLRLQKSALEEDHRRTPSTCYQEWIENNFISETFPAPISDRRSVSLVAQCARTSIPIEFLSRRLLTIRQTGAITVSCTPSNFFDQVAESHHLTWFITRRGL